MNYQARRKEERTGFRNYVKLHMKCNFITVNEVCSKIGISRNEFYNLLNGYNCSVPSKGINSFDEFESIVKKVLDIK